MTAHHITREEPAGQAPPALAARPALSVPFFEIGPKNLLRRPELHQLLAAAQRQSRRHGISVIATLPVTEIEPAASLFPDLHLFAQHMDPDRPGRSVGRVIAEALADAGASGVMLNHADHPMRLDDIAAAVERARSNGLMSLVCAADEPDAAAIATLAPDILLYEPRALIGHAGGARRPWIPRINALVSAIEPRTLIMHAGGIAAPEDARDVVRAGAAGTGATSAIIKARDRGRIVEGFLSALRQAHDG